MLCQPHWLAIAHRPENMGQATLVPPIAIHSRGGKTSGFVRSTTTPVNGSAIPRRYPAADENSRVSGAGSPVSRKTHYRTSACTARERVLRRRIQHETTNLQKGRIGTPSGLPLDRIAAIQGREKSPPCRLPNCVFAGIVDHRRDSRILCGRHPYFAGRSSPKYLKI